MTKTSLFLILLLMAATESFTQELHPASKALPQEKPYENSHFLTVDSVLLHYRTWIPEGEPRGKVILIHGFTGSSFSWRKTTTPLVDAGFFVVTADLPSFGYSSRYPELNQSNSNRAWLIWGLLDAIDGNDTTRWNVVGHSMGGGVAEAMAILEPGKTRSLTIVDGMVFRHSSNLTNTVSAAGRNRTVNRFMVEMAEKNVLTYKRISKLLKSAYGREPDSTEVLGYLTPLLSEGTVEAAFGVWTHSREVSEMDVAAISQVPVLVVWGSKDKWISKGKGRRFAKELPHGKFILIPGAGHIPMETHPAEFNNDLLDFLTR